MPANHRRLAPGVAALALAACGCSQESAAQRTGSAVRARGAGRDSSARAVRGAGRDTSARAARGAGLAATACGAAPASRRTPRWGRLAGGYAMARLSAYGGHLVLSRRDRRAACWRLMHWHDGALEALPVAPRAVPFDADAGSDAEGRPVVAYSVCAQDFVPARPESRLSKGCHLMLLHLGVPEQPQPLAAADVPGTSPTTPSMWRGNLAFSRHTDGGDTSEVVYLPRGATAPVPLPVNARPCTYECDEHDAYKTTVESLDLGSRAAVFVSRQDGGDTTGIGPEWTLRVAPLDGSKPRDLSTGFIDGACGFIYPITPTADGIGAFWDATGSPCEKTQTAFAEHHVLTKRRREAHDTGHEIWSAARDATATYWLRGAHGKGPYDHFPDQRVCTHADAACVLVRAPKLRWRTLRRNEILGPHPEEY